MTNRFFKVLSGYSIIMETRNQQLIVDRIQIDNSAIPKPESIDVSFPRNQYIIQQKDIRTIFLDTNKKIAIGEVDLIYTSLIRDFKKELRELVFAELHNPEKENIFTSLCIIITEFASNSKMKMLREIGFVTKDDFSVSFSEKIEKIKDQYEQIEFSINKETSKILFISSSAIRRLSDRYLELIREEFFYELEIMRREIAYRFYSELENLLQTPTYILHAIKNDIHDIVDNKVLDKNNLTSYDNIKAIYELSILDLNSVIEIYLGDSTIEGMEITLSKEIAFKEILIRTQKYRINNDVPGLVNRIDNIIRELRIIDCSFLIQMNLKIVNSNYYCGEFYELMNDSIQKSYPNLNLLNEYYQVRKDLLDIWSNDPEHIRHSSKYSDRRDLITSQEYFRPYDWGSIVTKSTKYSYESSCAFGIDTIKSIIYQCAKGDICIFPFRSDCVNSNELEILKNFILLFNVIKYPNSTLWITFFEHKDSKQKTLQTISEIQNFVFKLYKKVGFTFDILPYTIINQDETGKWIYSIFLDELDYYSNQYIKRKNQCVSRGAQASFPKLNFI